MGDAILLVAGAFLAAVFGLAAFFIQNRLTANATRQALGRMLYGELLTMAPGNAPLYGEPPTADLMALNSIPPLLSSGVLDRVKDDDLYMHLIWLGHLIN